jgi:antibiotic biosynthesis monooxygenase (ABM) superfamily enzyme
MAPKKWKLAILIWLFIYPTITLLFYVLGPFMSDWQPFARTLVLTLILVPLMVFVALPFIHRNFSVWLRK